MENNNKVRRPRISGGNGAPSRSNHGGYGHSAGRNSRPEGRSFGESRGFGGERRGEGRSSFAGRGEGRSFGEGRSNFGGERRSEGRSNFGGEKRGGFAPKGRGGFGGNRSEGRSFGEGRSSFGGERRSEGRSFQGGNRGFQGGNRSFQGGGFNKGPRGAKRPNQMQEMIDKKVEFDQKRFSDSDTAAPQAKDVIRLNKFIANSGVCSRREADDLILAGVVSVNGVVVTELGTKVNVFTDEIRYDGQLLKGEEKIYVVMNKPTGFVTTVKDPHADKTVMELLKDCPHRIFPVGRLDKNTTGVLMFTNDGEIAERLTHPSYDKKKIYQVGLDKPLSELDFEQIKAGLVLEDGPIDIDDLQYIDVHNHSKLGIEIHSGKNRIVRRIFESLGYRVKSLDRVYFAGLTKKNIKKGEWRYLTEAEINILRMGAYI